MNPISRGCNQYRDYRDAGVVLVKPSRVTCRDDEIFFTVNLYGAEVDSVEGIGIGIEGVIIDAAIRENALVLRTISTEDARRLTP